MKKLILASLLAAISASSLATDYFVVVPVPNRTPTTGNILVSLNSYALPGALAGRAYAGFDFNSVLQVKGDPAFNQAGVTWSLAGGALPPGMVLSPSGRLSGTPTAAGTATIQVQASYKTKSGQQSYRVIVAEVTVALATAQLPPGVQGAAYSYDIKPLLSVAGDPAFNPASVTWNYVGTLPPGLQLNTNGTITGVPTAEGTHPITVRATYLNQAGQQTYQVLVGAITVGLTEATLPAGVQGTAYRYDMKPLLRVAGDAAFAGTGATWSVASGSLPAGLVLGADGVISGVPAAENAGTPFSVQATYKTKNGQQAYSVLVGAIQIALSATTAPPPSATYGTTYNSWDVTPNVSISGDAAYDGKGTGVTWSVAGGSLPAGLVLNANGTVTGTPSARGTNPVQVKATYKGKSATQAYTVPFTEGISIQAGYRRWTDGTLAASCKEYRNGKPGYAYSGAVGNGYYLIDVDGPGGATSQFEVLCDMTTDGGGWTVIQRRVNGTVDFYRTWAEYAAGFGTVEEYWIGNNRLAALTAAGVELRIDMMRTNLQVADARYSNFRVTGAADAYRLASVSWVGGTAGDSLGGHVGAQFTTKDASHDLVDPSNNCAMQYKGAWWYTNCHSSNLNGLYLNGVHTSYADGIEWRTWTGYYESLGKVEMKVR